MMTVPAPPPGRNELHVVNFPAGHLMSTDCWCEPSDIHWETNSFGIEVLVIEHRDDVPIHHSVILEQRKDKQDWISTLLDKVVYHA